MTCEFLTKEKNFNICGLEMYGGRPSMGICLLCMERGENTREFAQNLFEREKKAHPEGVPKVSGCCDPPDQS